MKGEDNSESEEWDTQDESENKDSLLLALQEILTLNQMNIILLLQLLKMKMYIGFLDHTKEQFFMKMGKKHIGRL